MPPAFLPSAYSGALLNPDTQASKQAIQSCWKKYPKAKVGLSVLSFGIHGATRKKKRNDCIARAKASAQAKDKLSAIDKLWRSKSPWNERPPDPAGSFARGIGIKTGGAVAKTIAEGKRPPRGSKWSSLEWKATAIGGMRAMAAMGIEPWASLSMKFPSVRVQGKDPRGTTVVNRVRVGAEKLGDRISDLKAAAEYIQKAVNQNGLGKAAWYARGSVIAEAAVNAQHKQAKVEGGVATGLSIGAQTATTILAAVPITAPVTAPAAAIMSALSPAAKTMEGRTKLELAKAEGTLGEYRQKFQHEIERAQVREQIRQVKEILALQEQAAELERQLLDAEAKQEAERTATLIQAGVWVGVIGTGATLTYLIYNRLRKQ